MEAAGEALMMIPPSRCAAATLWERGLGWSGEGMLLAVARGDGSGALPTVAAHRGCFGRDPEPRIAQILTAWIDLG